MEFLGKMRTIWSKIAKRLRIRKKGLGKLRQDARTCEYEDVHILWDLIKKSDKETRIIYAGDRRKGHCFHIANWAKCAPFLQRVV